MQTDRFLDRRDAGQALAKVLTAFAGRADVLVLGLPRGGVPVAFEVAAALDAPLDVLVVRKLGVPQHEEYAMGAVASGGIRVLSRDVIERLRIPPAVVDRVTQIEGAELARRELEYRENAPPLDCAGRTVILVDDGLATGSSMAAAVAALRARHPRRIVVAVPVAAPDAVRLIRDTADEWVSVLVPQDFSSVGDWYADFAQTTDQEVRQLLGAARRRQRARAVDA